MAKVKKAYFCRECGFEAPKWLGRCPSCGEWNTFTEEVIAKNSSTLSSVATTAPQTVPQRVRDIKPTSQPRIDLHNAEVNRVLGGGLVPGSLILLGGEPGIGKSTLSLQLALSNPSIRTLYVSGEESLQQIKMRAVRIGEFRDELKLLAETDLDAVENVIQKTRPELVIIDSIQTMYNESVSSSPGSVSQVRESTGVLLRIAKTLQIPIFIVGHMTKDGNVAGPRVLEHMVDTVLYFEGERREAYRILRAAKNRFGSTNEIGVFEMRAEGLAEVANPSEYMLEGRPEGASGSVVACSMEGTRPIMIEIQALVSYSNFNYPRRTANGTDFNRVNLLMAVLEKRAHMNLSRDDAYINITGGVRMSEPAVDLGIVLAIASCKRDVPVDGSTVVFGEVGLSGEIRSVSMAEQRVREARKLGFRRVVLPRACMRGLSRVKEDLGVELLPVRTVSEAIDTLIGRS